MGGKTLRSSPRADYGVAEDVSRVEVNATTLAYRARGDGEPVVFVHGTASDLRTWARQLTAIGETHRAISYSRRYARPNEDIPAGRDDQMGQHVADLVALLGALDAAPAHLVGSSWGAFICLLAAMRHPEMVRSLVLEEPPVLSLFVSTPPRPAELVPLLVRRPRLALAIMAFGARTIAPAQRAFSRGEDEEAMRRFALGVLGKEGYARVPAERMQQMRENVRAMRAQLLGAGLPPLTEAEVRRVEVPALLVTGERSPAVLRLLSARLYELLPRADVVQIADASHRMHEEEPQAVNDAIRAFVDGAGHAHLRA